jgi:hypothetical protein
MTTSTHARAYAETMNWSREVVANPDNFKTSVVHQAALTLLLSTRSSEEDRDAASAVLVALKDRKS